MLSKACKDALISHKFWDPLFKYLQKCKTTASRHRRKQELMSKYTTFAMSHMVSSTTQLGEWGCLPKMQVVLASKAFSVIYLCSTSFQGIFSFLENQCFLLCSNGTLFHGVTQALHFWLRVSQWISSVTTFRGIPRNCNLWLAKSQKTTRWAGFRFRLIWTDILK